MPLGGYFQFKTLIFKSISYISIKEKKIDTEIPDNGYSVVKNKKNISKKVEEMTSISTLNL